MSTRLEDLFQLIGATPETQQADWVDWLDELTLENMTQPLVDLWKRISGTGTFTDADHFTHLISHLYKDPSVLKENVSALFTTLKIPTTAEATNSIEAAYKDLGTACDAMSPEDFHRCSTAKNGMERYTNVTAQINQLQTTYLYDLGRIDINPRVRFVNTLKEKDELAKQIITFKSEIAQEEGSWRYHCLQQDATGVLVTIQRFFANIINFFSGNPVTLAKAKHLKLDQLENSQALIEAFSADQVNLNRVTILKKQLLATLDDIIATQ